MSHDKIAVTVASPPFDHPNADVILRSSDNVDFHVFKNILSLTSPVFNDMFVVPQPTTSDDIKDGLPIVNVEENAEVLDKVLQYCYPGPDPKIETLKVVKTIIPAARKYLMDYASERIGGAYLRFMEVVEKPLKAFALARKFAMKRIGEAAVRVTLRYSVDELLQHNVDYDVVSLRDYHQILQYHYKCRVACQQLTHEFRETGIYRYPFLKCTDEHELNLFSGAYIPKWWLDHMRRIGTAFMHGGPLVVDVAGCEQALRDIDASGCASCKEVVPGQMTEIGKLFKAQVEATIAKVVLDIKF